MVTGVQTCALPISKAYLRLTNELKKSFYYDIPAGTGKTIGLAIAVACCDSLSIIYTCKNHSRLEEFFELYSNFANQVDIAYIKPKQEEFNLDELQRKKVILMTNSMLINSSLGRDFMYTGNIGENLFRTLIIDELPDFINTLYYSKSLMQMFFRTLLITPGLINKENFETGIPPILLNSELAIRLIENQFNSGAIWFNDIAINKPKSSERGLHSKGFLLNLVRKLEWRDLNDLNKLSLNFSDEEDNIVKYLTIKELYSNRSSNLLILDATASLYSDLIESEEIGRASCRERV